MVLSQLFQIIQEEIPGYIDAAVGRLDGTAFSSGNGELLESREQLLLLARDFVATYNALGGPIDFGSNEELLITASRGYLVLRIDRSKGIFVVVQLSSNGNVGYLRFRVRKYLRDAARALGVS